MDHRALEEVARRHGVQLVVRFGSSVKGGAHATSDVDLGVVTHPTLESFAAISDLAADLQRLDPSREVDVALLNHADPLFLKQVTEHCELVYGEPARLEALKLYAFKRYQDYRRYLGLEQEYVDRKLAAFGS